VSANWTSVSVSSTGQYQAACGFTNGPIYTSSNYGNNWSLVTNPTNLNWTGISISANGLFISAVASGNAIWTYNGIPLNSVFVPEKMAIGKNTITNGYTLDVSGNVNATGYYSTSDCRIKDNARPITSRIDELHPVAYFNRLSGKEDMGFIAHELQEHFPFLVNGEKDGEDYQSVNYLGLVGVLVKEFQEIKATTKDLEDRMTNLEAKK
jgi:hypothetical protein